MKLKLSYKDSFVPRIKIIPPRLNKTSVNLLKPNGFFTYEEF